MALVSLNCPNCGGSLRMEDTMGKGFCMYCGTAFLVKDEIQRIQVEHSGTVNLNLNREIEVENLLIRAEQKIEEYRSQGYSIVDYYSKIVNDYLEKALDISPRSSKVQEMKNRLNSERNKQIKKQIEDQIEDQRATNEAYAKKNDRNAIILVSAIFGVLGLIILYELIMYF